MRVLIAPDSFGESMSAVQAAQVFADGWNAVKPADLVAQRPMSDGGPGFVEVVGSGTPGKLIPVATTDPLGRPTMGAVLLAEGGAAYVESAQAAGLHLLSKGERDPRITSSYGVGTLMLAAAEAGAHTIYVGLGGSGTNDGGVGMLAAVGIVGRDGTGQPLPPGGAALIALESFDGFPLLRRAKVVAATDVDNPLLGIRGATAVFGPQKGADAAMVQQLDLALTRFAEVAMRDIPAAPPRLHALPGAGAAGGLGAAIFALNGTRRSGVEIVREAVGFDKAVEGVDLVITGEGKFDEQSVGGKVAFGVAQAAQNAGLPCLVVAGQLAIGRRRAASYGFEGEYSMSEHAGSVEKSLADPTGVLRSLAGVIAAEWSF